MKSGYLVWDLIKFTLNSVIKLSVLLNINFKWAIDDSKGHLIINLLTVF